MMCWQGLANMSLVSFCFLHSIEQISLLKLYSWGQMKGGKERRLGNMKSDGQYIYLPALLQVKQRILDGMGYTGGTGD